MRTSFPALDEMHARQRWYLLKDPTTVPKVLAHDRYWTVPFLHLYVSKISALVYEDADRAANLVDPLGQLAEQIRVDPDDPKRYQSTTERRSWIVYAWAVRSTTNLVASRLEEGRHSLEIARKTRRGWRD